MVDECTGPVVANWLRDQKHEVFSVYDEARGMRDDDIIKKAANEDWILVTNDKDFGEEVYRRRRPHCGVVLLRLANQRASNKVAVLQRLLASHADRIHDQFVVVTEKRVRFGRRTYIPKDSTP